MKNYTYQRGKISPADVLAAVRALDPARAELYRQRDDIAGARLFADVFGDVARFNATANAWYTYDGVRWAKDTGAMTVENYAKMLHRALMVYCADAEDGDFVRFITRYGDRHKRKSQIEDARDLMPVKTEDLDKDPFLFNCANCVIDLKTGERLEHDPGLLLSKVSRVTYDPEARSALFERFLDEIMQGDEGKIRYLQELFGYALTGTNEQEEAYFFFGSTTRNGKSTLLDTVGHMFGDYGMNMQPETLAQQKERNSRSASGDIARLDGCRFLHMSEPPKRMKMDVALLKTLLGRDRITARNLYEREFEFTPVFKLFINTNFLPLVTDDTLFSSGRVKVITFDRHFEPEEQDPKLKSKLKGQGNIAGIFNWCLAGLRRYLANGETLRTPDAVQKATQEYRESSDKIKQFFTDCMVPDTKGSAAAKRMYEVYSQWCSDNGFGTENKANFMDELRNRNLLSRTGTVDGVTVYNVVKGYSLDESILTGNPFKTGRVENVETKSKVS